MAEQRYSFYNFFIKLNKFKKTFKFICFYKLCFTLKMCFLKNKFYYLFDNKYYSIYLLKINFNTNFNTFNIQKLYKYNEHNTLIYNIILI